MNNTIKIKVRGIIVDQGNIFLCKLAQGNFFCLPGGTMDPGETRKQTLEREMIEELNVKPMIGDLVYINEFIWGEKNEHTSIDFWYTIENTHDFYDIDLSQASHGHEHSEVGFYDLEDVELAYKPTCMKQFLTDLIQGKQTISLEYKE